MANYQVKRTVGEHYEDVSFSSAKETIKWLKQYVGPEEEVKAKAKEDEEVAKKKEEKAQSKKTKKKEK